jgi:phospholipase/carboxylesterase
LNESLATIDLNPSGDHPKASVIWLHGLGADANDFVPIVEQFDLLNQYKVRFVFPAAPIRSITVNGGMRMRGWYDIAELDIARREDALGIQDSARLLAQLIEREKALGIPYDQIVLAGFSQGGALALHTGLRYPERLGGIIALSCYLPLLSTFLEERNPANQATPIFMAHGLFDPVVPLMLGEQAKTQLEQLDYKVSWKTYPMPHTVLPEEIDDIGQFLLNRM